ncbi:MAG: DEAD/DEAH box helicase [Deltaproteobacteria bacterium]|nr:DEAD/DEAH box helicase [Deltaproteobacteria bacterium]
MIQATWCPDQRLFFWHAHEDITAPLSEALPELPLDRGTLTDVVLVHPSNRFRRRTFRGLAFAPQDTLSALAHLPRQRSVSDSLHVWSLATLLAMELAIHHQVTPATEQGCARWRATWSRPVDRDRLRRLTEALPQSAHATPTQERGALLLREPTAVLREYIDTVLDHLFRQGVHPLPSRGWIHAMGQALRGADATFSHRDPTAIGALERLADVRQEHRQALVLGLRLHTPPTPEAPFLLEPLAWSEDRTAHVRIDEAWRAGSTLTLAGVAYHQPAMTLLAHLARAARRFPPLREMIQGPEPHSLSWTATQAWRFLTEGAAVFDGSPEIRLDLPPELAARGTRRLVARLHILGAGAGVPNWSAPQRCQWEVTLGDEVLTGPALDDLLAVGSPLVLHRGEWVFLDERELERIRSSSQGAEELPGLVALVAILTGEYQGAPVVADHRIDAVLEAIRHPPQIEVPEGFQGTLRPYQREGLSWLQTLGSVGLGACLADDMGLGKTIQLIAYLLTRQGNGPALVVCPASVLGNWQRELRTFAPSLRALRYHGLQRELADVDQLDVVLTTYSLMARDVELLAEVSWDTLTLDEAQSIKNADSKRADAARKLTARHRIALSGTPVENRLDELWALFDFLIPGLLGSRGTFQRTYAIPIERFADDLVATQLKAAVGPFLLRRKKTDEGILSDLPDKREAALYCELSPEQEALYQSVTEEALSDIEGDSGSQRSQRVLTMLTRLKQVCNHPAQLLKDGDLSPERSGKLVRVLDLIGQIAERGERAILFTQYRVMGDMLQQVLAQQLGLDIPFLHGGTPLPERDAMVHTFQEGRLAAPVLLISLRAGGTGLNLTRATHVIHYDRWWNPAVEDQATDRAHRIGQTRELEVHKLVTLGTLEERIADLLDAKRSLADRVMTGGEHWLAELDDASLRQLVSLSATQETSR